jgi:hypothetical protein
VLDIVVKRDRVPASETMLAFRQRYQLLQAEEKTVMIPISF